jgi:hypothetical protein
MRLLPVSVMALPLVCESAALLDFTDWASQCPRDGSQARMNGKNLINLKLIIYRHPPPAVPAFCRPRLAPNCWWLPTQQIARWIFRWRICHLALGCRIGGGPVRPAATLPGAGGKVRCAPGPFGFEGTELIRKVTLELMAGEEPVDATTGQLKG